MYACILLGLQAVLSNDSSYPIYVFIFLPTFFIYLFMRDYIVITLEYAECPRCKWVYRFKKNKRGLTYVVCPYCQARGVVSETDKRYDYCYN